MFWNRKLNTFDEKNVLITGCSKGIGREIALQIGSKTKVRNLVIVARSVDKLKDLKAEIGRFNSHANVYVEQCDIGSISAIEKLLADIASVVPTIDIIINDAALIDMTYFDRSKWKNVMDEINVNVVGTTFLLHNLIPKMVERGSGGVINIGSASGVWEYPGSAAYNGSKHYIHGFTECLKLELVDTGVFVTEVIPGPVSTEGWQEAQELIGNDTWLNICLKNFPLLAQINAPQCASEIIGGFENGNSIIVPGLLFSIGMTISALFPGFLVRMIGSFLSPRFRAHQKMILNANDQETSNDSTKNVNSPNVVKSL